MKSVGKCLTQTAPDDGTLLFIYLPLKDRASLESHPNCMDIGVHWFTVVNSVGKRLTQTAPYNDNVKSVGKCFYLNSSRR